MCIDECESHAESEDHYRPIYARVQYKTLYGAQMVALVWDI